MITYGIEKPITCNTGTNFAKAVKYKHISYAGHKEVFYDKGVQKITVYDTALDYYHVTQSGKKYLEKKHETDANLQ